MKMLTGFPPIEGRHAKVLILGSMPGEESLRQQEYYAFPRNAFWFIMGELFDAGPEHPYPTRIEKLKLQRIALWDVLKHCKRERSLDSDIKKSSIILNDFESFFKRQPKIRAIFFNGKKSEEVFKRLALPKLKNVLEKVEKVSLPSTSPAFASLKKEDKLERWKVIKEFLS